MPYFPIKEAGRQLESLFKHYILVTIQREFYF
jgi:hypothetical protein